MKLREAIDRIDSLKHNTYTTAEKVEWISRLEGLVKNQIIDTHEDGENIEFNGYTVEADMEKELLIPAPYDDAYIKWLEAKIDYYNGEIARYNNSVMMYQAVYDSYQRYYNRNHMPKGQIFKF
jgi:hypothetical protein